MIEFTGVSKSFRHGMGAKLLRTAVREAVRGKDSREFFALRDVSFRLTEGEAMAIVGRNGAGKSTLLSIVAGLTEPSEGEVNVRGRVAALLELGSGFHHDLTGRENVRLNASLLGISRKRTEEAFDRIVEFADIGDFINEPIRTYSTGMVMRLAFSVAVNVDPDILIVDEVLGVGDQGFQAKCHDRLFEFKRAGKTLLFVSHSTGLVSQMCERALWLDRGRLVMDGEVGEVTAAYDLKHGAELTEQQR